MQRKQDMIRSSVSCSRFNELSAMVIDTRSLLRQGLDVHTAMNLILSRTQKATGASGAAVCIAEKGTAEYLAGTGAAISLAGVRFPEIDCPFFERVRANPVVDWGDLEEPKAKQRIPGTFELRAPICCGGRLVGCLNLFSRFRQFSSETVYICELMAFFLGQLLENHGVSAADQPPPQLWRSQQDLVTEAVHRDVTCLRLDADRVEPAAQNFSFEAKKSNQMIAEHTGTPVSSTINRAQRHYSSVDDEEEQLPTIDQLLRQLGTAYQEGFLPELPNPTIRPNPHRGSTSLDKAGVVLSIADMARNSSAVQHSELAETVGEVAPESSSHEHGSGRRAGFRNAAPFIFPVFVLVYGVMLNIIQTPLGLAIQALTLAAIVLSIVEIWRARYGDR
jgi:hypothetical protein